VFKIKTNISRFLSAAKNSLRPAKYGWFGNYASWQQAENDSSGYDSAVIVEKVKDALLKVKRGDAAFERDSVVFSKTEYVWPVLAGLLWIAAQRKSRLNVLDFGGSLGSTFFQYRRFLSTIDVQWNVVEQGVFIDYGVKYFQDTHLRFYYTVEECLKGNVVDVILLSSVLPYLDKPYHWLDFLMSLDVPFIIFDKMPFLVSGEDDRLTVQKVPPSIYEASYPAWFFNEAKFMSALERKYDLVESFEGDDKANIPSVFKGFIFSLKNK
jgi:putative methyltransferase (TIGR04325 family)